MLRGVEDGLSSKLLGEAVSGGAGGRKETR